MSLSLSPEALRRYRSQYVELLTRRGLDTADQALLDRVERLIAAWDDADMLAELRRELTEVEARRANMLTSIAGLEAVIRTRTMREEK